MTELLAYHSATHDVLGFKSDPFPNEKPATWAGFTLAEEEGFEPSLELAPH
jgi:hypothetical protein